MPAPRDPTTTKNAIPPDEVRTRMKMIAAAEGKGFYEWLKDELVNTCPDERTLPEMLRDIREDHAKHGSE